MIYYLKRFWKIILTLLVVVGLLIGGYLISRNSKETTISSVSIVKEENTKEVNDTISTIFVEIKGAVNNPGVYEMDEGKRVIDAINLAGGLLKNAYTGNINLSKKLRDEMYIIVYTNYEINKYKEEHNIKENVTEEMVCVQNECVCPDISNDACIKENVTEENNESIISKISINNATKEELMTLNSIGESKAEAIIQYRNENNGFNNIEEIKNVSGIGDALFNKIKDNITL